MKLDRTCDPVGAVPTGGVEHLTIAIAIATVGRPAVVSRTIQELRAQTRPPDAIVVCAPTGGDLGGLPDAHPHVRFLTGTRGLCHQRNAILRSLDAFDVAIFIDDDFVPCPRYVEFVETILSAHPDVVVTTGSVAADGILGPGLTFEAAREILRAAEGAPYDPDQLEDVYNGYGCNMSVRLRPVREHAIFFDEALPLYAWLEDVDFSRRLAKHGRIVKTSATRGVHLGVKSGRQSGIRLGYSQIANPVYLVRKGTCPWRRALFLMSRNLAANLVGCLRPEPYVDRVGRAAGNARAILDLVTGRLSPSRVLSL